MDMTDTPHLPTTPSTAGPARTDAAWLEAHWMPYTGNRQFKAKASADGQRQGRVLHRRGWQADF